MRKNFERALHVSTADGKLIRGGRAFLFIAKRLGWGFAADALSVPPFIWLVEMFYRIVASNRSFFANFLFRGYED